MHATHVPGVQKLFRYKRGKLNTTCLLFRFNGEFCCILNWNELSPNFGFCLVELFHIAVSRIRLQLDYKTGLIMNGLLLGFPGRKLSCFVELSSVLTEKKERLNFGTFLTASNVFKS